MDSGVSILNLSTSRKVLSLLRSITGLHLWCGLGTVKPERCYIFQPVYCVLWQKRLDTRSQSWIFWWVLYPEWISGTLTNLGFEMNGRTQPLVIMFNSLFRHLFDCQSLLKERRQPPGGLREAILESLGGGVSTPSSPGMSSGASVVWFPLPEENNRLLLGGDHERACFDRVRNPENL